MANQGKDFYLPWIDGLRAIAALSVVFHHGPMLTAPQHLPLKNFLGWFGVDLFLVLSAFLLSRLLLLEYRAYGKIEILNFYIRRALRIWPLYFFFITAALIYGFTFHILSVRELTGWYLAHLTFTQNIEAAIHGYSLFPFSAHLWTIALEEQAYLLIPIGLAIALQNYDETKFIKGVLVASVLFVLIRLAVVILGRVHPLVWVSPLRADTFLIGTLLGICSSVGTNETRRNSTSAWSMIGAIVLGAAVYLMGPPGASNIAEVIGYTLMASACCLLILAVDNSMLLAALLGSRLIRHLGKISYGIYVFHFFALAQSDRVLARFHIESPRWKMLIGTLATLVLAEISYQLLERRFLLLKTKFTAIRNRPV